MHFQIKKTAYTVPGPVPRKGELVLAVKSYILMPAPRRASSTQFVYRNLIRKLLFFLFREGILCTLRKAFYGGLLYNRILRERKIYCIHGINRNDGQEYIALGATGASDFDELAVADAWAMKLPDGYDCAKAFYRVLALLRNKDSLLEAVFRYSPFEEKEPIFRLSELFQSQPEAEATPDAPPEIHRPQLRDRPKTHTVKKRNPRHPDMFLVGAGVYGCGFILQFLRGVHHRMLIDADPVIAARVGELFHFEEVDTDANRGLQRLADTDNAVLCIATYHSTHLDIIESALAINPKVHIFLEKPPVTTFEQLDRLLELRKNGANIEIGYNRRSLKVVRRLKHFFAGAESCYTVAAQVKELNLPDFHWYYWPNQKTRITGNLCHWIDLGCVFILSRPTEIFINPHPRQRPGDEIDATILFSDGSKISLHSTDLGDPLRGVQEYLDIRSDTKTAVIDDFLRVTTSGEGKRHTRHFWFRNKGHADMYKQYAGKLRKNRASSDYSNEDLLRVSVIYITMSEMSQRGVCHARIEWDGDRYRVQMYQERTVELLYGGSDAE